MKRVPYDSLEYVDEDVMRLNGEPFTGVGYAHWESGPLEVEATFEDGLQTGDYRAWSEAGTLTEERTMLRGLTHGKKREWHDDGTLYEESLYEHGFELRRRRWDENGKLTEDYELDKEDPFYKQLLRYRDTWRETTRVPYGSIEYTDDGLYCLDGKRFAGVAFSAYYGGCLEYEGRYEHGLENGLERTWLESTRPETARELWAGVVHGKERRWYPNGLLEEETDCELGIVLREKLWDEDGNLVKEYELQETDSDFALLQHVRRAVLVRTN